MERQAWLKHQEHHLVLFLLAASPDLVDRRGPDSQPRYQKPRKVRCNLQDRNTITSLSTTHPRSTTSVDWTGH